jgi:parallel beta-helix repeat protein
LIVNNGAISAPAAFEIGSLTNGTPPSAMNGVPIEQGGENAAVSYGAFMSGLSTISGIDGSELTASAAGGTVFRRLADHFADALSVESFGAVGDGLTDDTTAFAAAAASGRPIRLDGKVYIVNGPITFIETVAVTGISGQTIVRRASLTPSPFWIQVSSVTFDAHGIVFDAGSLSGSDLPAVLVNSSSVGVRFSQCSFVNATGSSAGIGISISGTSGSNCTLRDCVFENNSLHGLEASGMGSIEISSSYVANNGNCGLRFDALIACQIRDSIVNDNAVGISVAEWNAGAASQQLGPTCVITGNECESNSIWGIAVAASGALVADNSLLTNGSLTSGGGVLARLGASRLHGNFVNGGNIGIDARGCWATSIDLNHVSSSTVGIMVGGSQNITISGNVLLLNGWGLLVSGIEPTISFLPSGPMSLDANWIGFSSAQGGGISVLDAAAGLAIIGNDINGWGSADFSQAIWLHTDAAVMNGNRWNNSAQFIVQASPVAGLEALILPDTADEILVTSAPLPIASILTAHQANTLGQVTFIKVETGGIGYTQAQVVLKGLGAGASASVVVSSGQVIWIIVTNPGSGYGPIGSLVSATITGDGSGALAVAYAGLPALTGRHLRLSCNCMVQLALQGSSPSQQSWTGFAFTIPAFGAAELQGIFGNWRAVAFPPVDYVAPTGDGGAILQSVSGGNLTLRPSSGGALHFSNANEASGCTSSVGRGSPLGTVSAPPGSDFRNLNGGAGNTFWVKQNNSDATGWIAIA